MAVSAADASIARVTGETQLGKRGDGLVVPATGSCSASPVAYLASKAHPASQSSEGIEASRCSNASTLAFEDIHACLTFDVSYMMAINREICLEPPHRNVVNASISKKGNL